MLTTFFLAIPVFPAMAAPVASLSISPRSFNAFPGSSFTATVMVSNAPNLEAYDFKVLFDPNILQVTSTSLTGTLFDPNTQPVIVAKADVFNTIGIVRYAVTFFGGTTVSTDGALLFITFQVNNPFQGTASELPSAISIDSSLIGYLFPGPGTYNIAHTVSGASYAPGNSMAFRSDECHSFSQGWSLSLMGFNPTMYCRLLNNGANSVQGGAVFAWHSLGGITGSNTGTVATYAPGAQGESDSSIALPSNVNQHDFFVVTGTAATFYGFPDGTSFAALGPSANFKINIVP
jgi:hypothetical protein